MEAKAPVKTESATVVPLRAYTVVKTLNEIEAEALLYTQAYKFPTREYQSQCKRGTLEIH